MTKKLAKNLLLLAVLLAAVSMVARGAKPVSGSFVGGLQSPVSTPQVTLVPTPTVPEETKLALMRIAAREGIPLEQLSVVTQYRKTYSLLDKNYWVVTALGVNNRWYDVMIDLSDRSTVDDINVVEQAERAAYRAKYGKMHPALYDRLQQVTDDAVLPVADWHARIPAPTLADAILDRLVHQAHRLELKGESMRKTRTPLS